MTLAQNLDTIQQRIANACAQAGRSPDEIRLLLATKTVEAPRILQAFEHGHNLIAENRIQEVKEKHQALQNTPFEHHFIGHLQTNKIKDLLRYKISCLQSLDRWRLAKKLHQRLLFEKKTLDVFIQINTSGETSKFGMSPDKALDFITKVSTLETIHIKGLMTIGLFSSDATKVRRCFKKLKSLQQQVLSANIPRVQPTELSMGMSQDLEIAIQEGATIIRIGTAIFGEREYPDSYYWNEES